MLIAIRVSDGARVMAYHAVKGVDRYVCPFCGAVLLLKKGAKVVHHFAHDTRSACSESKGETFWHMEAKMRLYTLLRHSPGVADVEVEKPFGHAAGSRRADVFARVHGVPCAFELQHSSITPAEIETRTQTYNSLGIAVMWVVVNRKFYVPVESTEARFREWWKYLDTLYGCLYFFGDDGIYGTSTTPAERGFYCIELMRVEYGYGDARVLKSVRRVLDARRHCLPFKFNLFDSCGLQLAGLGGHMPPEAARRERVRELIDGWC